MVDPDLDPDLDPAVAQDDHLCYLRRHGLHGPPLLHRWVHPRIYLLTGFLSPMVDPDLDPSVAQDGSPFPSAAPTSSSPASGASPSSCSGTSSSHLLPPDLPDLRGWFFRVLYCM
jgi:hypothetical protein